MKRVISMLLALVLLFSCVEGVFVRPVSATEVEDSMEAAQLITEPICEETVSETEPEETAVPTEPEETAVPTEPEETAVLTEPEETAAPTEPEETAAPTEPEETFPVEEILEPASVDTDVYTLTLDEKIDLSLASEETAYCQFTPAESGVYVLSSENWEIGFYFSVYDPEDNRVTEQFNRNDNEESYHAYLLKGGMTYTVNVMNYEGETISDYVLVSQLPTYDLDTAYDVTLSVDITYGFCFCPEESGFYDIQLPTVWDGDGNPCYPNVNPNYDTGAFCTYGYITEEVYYLRWYFAGGEAYCVKVENCTGYVLSGAISITSVEKPTSISLSGGGTVTWDGNSESYDSYITCYFEPGDTRDALTWTVDQEGIVELSDTRDAWQYFKPIGYGTVQITATTDNGLSASCTVTVAEPTYLTLDQAQDVSLAAHEVMKFNFVPDETGYYQVYSPYDSDGQYVWDDFYRTDWGYVGAESSLYGEYGRTRTFYLEADVNYTLVVENNCDSDITTSVTVSKPGEPDSMTLSETSRTFYLEEGESSGYHTLTAYLPEGTYSAVRWSTDSELVELDGEVRGYINYCVKGHGTFTITATTDNGLSASCTIYAGPHETLSVGDACQVPLDGNAYKDYRFTPEESGVYCVTSAYVWYTDGNGDTYSAAMYVDFMTGSGSYCQQVGSESDDTERRFYAYLEGGETYTFRVQNYESTSGTGSIWLSRVADAESITLPETKTYYGLSSDTRWLNATVLPEDSYAFLEWTSSDESVVRIGHTGGSNCGFYTVGYGTAVITATASNGVTDSCTVTVAERPVLTTEQSCQFQVAYQESMEFAVTVTESGYYNVTVPEVYMDSVWGYETWVKCSPNIYLVTDYGDESLNLFGETYNDNTYIVTYALEAGQTYVLRLSNWESTSSISGEVTLTACPEAESITLDQHNIRHYEIVTDCSWHLGLSVSPDGSATSVTWTSSDEDVVSISHGSGSYCNYMIHGYGTAVITATAANGATDSCTVTVAERPVLTTEQSGQYQLAYQGSMEFAVTVSETGYYNVTLPQVYTDSVWGYETWVVCSPNMYRVTDGSYDYVDRIGSYYTSGTYQITYALEAGQNYVLSLYNSQAAGELSGEVTLTACPEAESITLDQHNIRHYEIVTDCSWHLGLSVSPDGSATSVTWTSSNEDVVSISHGSGSYCNYMIHGYGTAVITATAANGATDSCTVVIEPMEEIEADEAFSYEVPYQSEARYQLTVEESGPYRIVVPTVYVDGNGYCYLSSYIYEVTEEGQIYVRSDGRYSYSDDSKYYCYFELEAGKNYILALNNWAFQETQSGELTVEKIQGLESINLSDTDVTHRTLDETGWLNVQDIPYDRYSRLTWTSTNEDVVRIDYEWNTGCRYEVVGYGTAEIVVTASNGVTASCTVTVEAMPVYTIGETVNVCIPSYGECLEYTVTPEESGYYSVILPAVYNSSYDCYDCLSVSLLQDGAYVDGVYETWPSEESPNYVQVFYMEADTTYTLRINNYTNNDWDQDILLLQKTPEPEQIMLSAESMTFRGALKNSHSVGNSVSATYLPVGSYPSQATWTVSDASVISLSETNVGYAIFQNLAPGKSDLTVTTAAGLSATCAITILEPVAMTDTYQNLTLDVGEGAVMSFTPAKSGKYTFSMVTLTGDSFSVDVYDSQGNCVAYCYGMDDLEWHDAMELEAGETYSFEYFYYSWYNSDRTATCKVKIDEAEQATGLRLNKDQITCYEVDSNTYLSYQVLPAGAYADVTFISDNPDVADITESGRDGCGNYGYCTIYHSAYGTATISVWLNGELYTTVPVTVTEPPVLEKIVCGDVVGLAGYDRYVDFLCVPGDANNDCTVTIADESIAKLDFIRNQYQYFCLNLLKAGTTTATITDSTGVSTTFTITVYDYAPIGLNETKTLTLKKNDYRYYTFTAPEDGYYAIVTTGDLYAYGYGKGQSFEVRGDGESSCIVYLPEGYEMNVTVYNSQDAASTGTVAIEKATDPTSMTLGQTSMTYYFYPGANDTFSMKANFNDIAAWSDIQWSSSNEDVVNEANVNGWYDTVSNVYYFNVIKTGTTTITATSANGLSASCVVTVVEAPVAKTLSVSGPTTAQAGDKVTLQLNKDNANAALYLDYYFYGTGDGYMYAEDLEDGEFTVYCTDEGQIRLVIVDQISGLEATHIINVGDTLEAPVVKTSNIASTGKVKIKWDSVDGASKYMVYCATSKTGTYKRLITTSKTYVNNNSAEAGKTYYYYVIAVDAEGNQSEKSNIAYRCCDLAQPEITLSNIASTGKVKIKWEAVEGATKYEVYRATSKSGTYNRLAITEKLYVNHNSGVAGTTYYYKVRAICDVSAATSAFSAIDYRCCDLKRPEITLSNIASTGKVKIKWEAVDGAEEYQVWYATSKNGTYKRLTTTEKLYVNHNSGVAGTTYYYKVRALCDVSSATSAFSAIDYRCCDLKRPEITLTNVASSGKIKISWEAIEGATKYEVYRASSKNGTYNRISITSRTYVTNTSVVVGKTYYYKVRALCDNSSATSAYSAISSRVCDLKAPVASISRNTKGKPVITWDSVDGATKYEVWYATSKNGTYKRLITTENAKVVNSSAVAGKTYYYKVKAIHSNSNANSAYSAVVSITSK